MYPRNMTCSMDFVKRNIGASVRNKSRLFHFTNILADEKRRIKNAITKNTRGWILKSLLDLVNDGSTVRGPAEYIY